MDSVDWVKMVWIVMDNELSITKPIKIYNQQKLKSINKKNNQTKFLNQFYQTKFYLFVHIYN